MKTHIRIEEINPDPKPDAPTYKFVTIADLSRAATEENVERLIEVVASALRHKVNINLLYPETELQTIDWIDD